MAKTIRMSASKSVQQNKFWSFKKINSKSSKKEAELVLYGDISNTSWYDDEITPKQFNDDLEALGDIELLNIRINSGGGDVFAGQAIYSMIKRCKAETHGYVDGIAASAASLILVGCDKVIMPINSSLMIHMPWTIVLGNAKKLRKSADVLDTIAESVMVAYEEKTGLDREELTNLMEEETWMTAEQAVEKGFADEIEDTKVEMSIIDANNLLINGVKMSLKNTKQLKKVVNKDIKSNTEDKTHERAGNNMLKSLCKLFGLDYDVLNKAGNTDDQIMAMIVGIQSKAEAPESPTENTPSEPQMGAEEIKKQERERILGINNLCDNFKIEEKTRLEYLNSNMSLDQVGLKVLDVLKTTNAPLKASTAGDVELLTDERDKFVAAASSAILMRSSIKETKPADGAMDLRGMSLRDFAIECMLKNGVNNPHRMGDDKLFKMSLTPDSQFTSILDDSVNKSVSSAYAIAEPSFKKWVGIGSNKDFKTASHYRVSEAGNLEQITQTGELKFDELSDEKATKTVLSYGKMFGFTRQAMINDDLSILTTIPQKYVQSALRGRNKLVYAALTSSSTIYDGVVLFHSTHANYTASGTAMSTTSFGVGKAAMMAQTNQRGLEKLNILPKFVICSPTKGDVALQLLTSIADPASSNSGVANIYRGALEPVIDAELSGNAWYLAANPAECDTIEVTYLNGNEQPLLESQVGFDYAGIKWRIIDDFGVSVLDYRGLYKNAGA